MAVYRPRTVVVNSGAALVNEVIHPHPCIVHAVHATHSGGSATYVQLHDVSSAPPDGTVPTMVHNIAANSDADIEGLGWPVYFENGIYVCESTTVSTKTISISSDLFVYLILEDITH